MAFAAMAITRLLVAVARQMLPWAQARGMRLTVHVDRRLPRLVLGDYYRLQQVLANFVSNAIKFSPEGTGHVALHATLVELQDMAAAQLPSPVAVAVASESPQPPQGRSVKARSSSGSGSRSSPSVAALLARMMRPGGSTKVAPQPGSGASAASVAGSAARSAITVCSLRDVRAAASPAIPVSMVRSQTLAEPPAGGGLSSLPSISDNGGGVRQLPPLRFRSAASGSRGAGSRYQPPLVPPHMAVAPLSSAVAAPSAALPAQLASGSGAPRGMTATQSAVTVAAPTAVLNVHSAAAISSGDGRSDGGGAAAHDVTEATMPSLMAADMTVMASEAVASSPGTDRHLTVVSETSDPGGRTATLSPPASGAEGVGGLRSPHAAGRFSLAYEVDAAAAKAPVAVPAVVAGRLRSSHDPGALGGGAGAAVADGGASSQRSLSAPIVTAGNEGAGPGPSAGTGPAADAPPALLSAPPAAVASTQPHVPSPVAAWGAQSGAVAGDDVVQAGPPMVEADLGHPSGDDNSPGDTPQVLPEAERVVPPEASLPFLVEPGTVYDVRLRGGAMLTSVVAWVRLAVEDNGCGISEADQARLFTPFMQVQAGAGQKGKGTGLGLNICKQVRVRRGGVSVRCDTRCVSRSLPAQIAERHGGRIGCTSTAGRGSVFYVEVPLRVLQREAQGAATVAAAATAAPPSTSALPLGLTAHVAVSGAAVATAAATVLATSAAGGVTVRGRATLPIEAPARPIRGAVGAAAALQRVRAGPLQPLVSVPHRGSIAGPLPALGAAAAAADSGAATTELDSAHEGDDAAGAHAGGGSGGGGGLSAAARQLRTATILVVDDGAWRERVRAQRPAHGSARAPRPPPPPSQPPPTGCCWREPSPASCRERRCWRLAMGPQLWLCFDLGAVR